MRSMVGCTGPHVDVHADVHVLSRASCTRHAAGPASMAAGDDGDVSLPVATVYYDFNVMLGDDVIMLTPPRAIPARHS